MNILIVIGVLPLFVASQSLNGGDPDLILQLSLMSENLISILSAMADDPRASKAISRAFEDDKSVCLRSIDEAIQAIREGTRLVVAAEGDLRILNYRVESLIDQRGEAEAVKGLAAILRALEPLLRRISPVNPASKVCRASFDRTEAYLRGLAVVMQKFSESDLPLSYDTRDTFVESSVILSAVTGFLRQLRIQTKEFRNFCSSKDSSIRSIRAMGEIIASLADLFSTLGNIRAGEKIRLGTRIIDNIVVQMQAMTDNNENVVVVDCEVKDFNTAATAIEDMAILIQDIGFENLRKELGIDITFDFEISDWIS